MERILAVFMTRDGGMELLIESLAYGGTVLGAMGGLIWRLFQFTVAT